MKWKVVVDNAKASPGIFQEGLRKAMANLTTYGFRAENRSRHLPSDNHYLAMMSVF